MDQVISPHLPGVHAGRLNLGQPDIFALEPCHQIAIEFNEAILRAARDPQQMNLRIGGGAELRKIRRKIVASKIVVAIVDCLAADKSEFLRKHLRIYN